MSNPLLSPQREKAGSQTFSKYSYQYHWALQKAIVEHKNQMEYAIFVEYHEDVIFSNSLDKNKAKFEFNQIKTDKGAFSVKKLTKTKNNKSIIGKLLDSTNQKPYSGIITEINLIAVNGFNFKLKDPKLNYEKVNISDVDKCDIKKISDQIQKEITNCKLPSNLNFVIPRLKEENHQKVLIGEISELIASLFPRSNYDSTHIYKLLIDELFRKGQDQFDYKNWDSAIQMKSLTSQKIIKTLNEYTSHKDDAVIESQFLDIANELGYKVIEKKEISRAFNRYKNRAYGSRSPQQLRIAQDIKASIERNFHSSNNEIAQLIDLVYIDISEDNRIKLGSKKDAIGAIIYEFITIK